MTLAPFAAIWAVASIVAAVFGQGWLSLVCGFAAVGIIALLAERPKREEASFPAPGLRDLLVAMVAGGLVVLPLASPALIPVVALSFAGAVWLSKLVWFDIAEWRANRAGGQLEHETEDGRLSFMPDESPAAAEFRDRFVAALSADMHEAAALARTAPDGWLLPVLRPDMDIGAERLADAITDNDPELAERLYRIAEHGCAIEYAFATAGAAGLATSAKQQRVRGKIVRLRQRGNAVR